jgi:hypothetical protein
LAVTAVIIVGDSADVPGQHHHDHQLYACDDKRCRRRHTNRDQDPITHSEPGFQSRDTEPIAAVIKSYRGSAADEIRLPSCCAGEISGGLRVGGLTDAEIGSRKAASTRPPCGDSPGAG